MKHIILYAHPDPGSFNHTILETTVKTAESKGHEVNVRDLYALDFNPVLKESDFEGFQSGNTPQDIKTEQEYITNADVIIMIYPIWWTGMPAILKGYIDRVFSYGYAYTEGEDGDMIGLLKGKKALVINTHGTPKEVYDDTGMTVALKKTSDTGIFEFCGVEVADHLLFGSMPPVDEAAGEAVVSQLENKIHSLF
jgi:NAD(P)H dehydrogenase (quinone)